MEGAVLQVDGVTIPYREAMGGLDMANRASRRHPPVNGGVAQGPVALPEPVLVGELRVEQARELRTLDALIVRLEEQAIQAQNVLAIVGMHKREAMRRILVEGGIDPTGIYNIDPESGHITRTHDAAVPAG